MSCDDIIRMALEHFGAVLKPSDLEVKLAALALAAEREACAELCQEMEDRESPYERNVAVLDCASAIRARGET